MKKIVVVIAALFLLSPTTGHSERNACSEAVKDGKEAYNFAKKANKAESFEEAIAYAKKAEHEAEEAKSAADRCGCKKAEKDFDDAHEYAEKASEAKTHSEIFKYTEKAMHEAKEGIERAQH